MDLYPDKTLFTDPNDNDTLTAIIIKSLGCTLHLEKKQPYPELIDSVYTKQKRPKKESTPFNSNMHLHAFSSIVSKSNLRLYAEYMFAVKPAW